MKDVEPAKVLHASAMAADLRVLMSKARRRTRAARPDGYSESQLHALSRLDHQGPMTGTALALAEGMRPQSMSVIVSALERDGLVTRSSDPNDGRQSIFALTPKAGEMIAAYRLSREDWLFQAIKTKLNRKAQAELAASLVLLRRLLEM